MDERLNDITKYSIQSVNEKYIYFHNDTELPLIVDSWIIGSNKLYCRKIEAGERKIIHSSVGEWHLNFMFTDDDYQLWVKKEPEFTKYNRCLLGNFRSKPCAMGEYSWMEYDEPFHCEYSVLEPDENKVTGQIRFYKKV
jgi:hypothetical protein